MNVSTDGQILGYDRYDLNNSEVVMADSNGVSVSSYLPLWAGLFPASDGDWNSPTGQQERDAMVESFENSGLVQIGKNRILCACIRDDMFSTGGILTTTVSSGQQWDSPNAWPPVVLLIIEGLRTLQVDSAVTLAVR